MLQRHFPHNNRQHGHLLTNAHVREISFQHVSIQDCGRINCMWTNVCLNCANWWEGQPSHRISVTCSAVHGCERMALLSWYDWTLLHSLSNPPTGSSAVPLPYVAEPAAPGVCQPNKQRSPVISSSRSSAWTLTNIVVPEDYTSYAWQMSQRRGEKNL